MTAMTNKAIFHRGRVALLIDIISNDDGLYNVFRSMKLDDFIYVFIYRSH